MKKIFALGMAAAINTGFLASNGQDIRHSPFEVTPMSLNPALAGMFNGGFRVSGLYRSHFEEQEGMPFLATNVAADGVLYTGRKGQYLGGGIHLTRDLGGDGDIVNSGVYGSLAYRAVLMTDSANKQNKMELSAGLQAGFTQREYNFSAVYFGSVADYYNVTGFPPYTHYPLYQRTYYPVSAGISFSHATSQRFNYIVGVTTDNINSQRDLITKRADRQTNMDYYTTIVAGANWTVLPRLRLRPAVVYITGQSTTAGYMFGADICYSIRSTGFDAAGGHAVFAGGWIRTADVMTITAGDEFKRFKVGISIDIPYYTGDATRIGAFEFYIRYTAPGSSKKRKTIACNRF